MPCTNVMVPTDDGTCPATVHTPAPSGSWPGVILYPDAAGVRETFCTMATRLAGLGYAVLLPEVYYRVGGYPPFDLATVFGDPAEWERLMSLAQGLTADMAVRDAGAFLEFLTGRPEVFGTTVGTTGYCMGGWISLIVAGNYPALIAAAASFHGGRLAAEDDPDSPALLADRIRATVYVAAATNDPSFPPEQHQRLEQALTTAGVTHTIQTYPAAHGFAVPDNPAYNADADQQHWTALTNLYATSLHSGR